jgi:hypothetical protein
MGMKGVLDVTILFLWNKLLEKYTALVSRIYRGQIYIESFN